MIGMIVIGITCIAIIFTFVRYDDTREKSFEKERQQWQQERQQLLDRIQAPTYDHLKHHEAKLLKASKEPVKETNPLEVV